VSRPSSQRGFPQEAHTPSPGTSRGIDVRLSFGCKPVPPLKPCTGVCSRPEAPQEETQTPQFSRRPEHTPRTTFFSLLRSTPGAEVVPFLPGPILPSFPLPKPSTGGPELWGFRAGLRRIFGVFFAHQLCLRPLRARLWPASFQTIFQPVFHFHLPDPF